MIYFTPTTAHLDTLSDQWGIIRTPASYVMHTYDRLWMLDNGMFTKRKTIKEFWKFLDDMKKYQDTCAFVVCPDVVYNCLATMDWYRQFAWRIKADGWKVAFVAQDGQESYPIPDYDVLFIGGSTEWKLSDTVEKMIRKAKGDGKWVHVGRVNTQKRIRHFQHMCVNSVDGTAPIFGPDINIPRIDRQLRKFHLFCDEDN